MVLALLVGCGRVAFDDRTLPDAMPDAMPDAITDRPSPKPAYIQGALQQVTTTPADARLPRRCRDRRSARRRGRGALSDATSISDSQGDAFTQLLTFDNAASASRLGFAWWAIAAGGPTTVSITYQSATTHTMALLEYAHAGAHDGTVGTQGNSAVLDPGAIGITAADLLIVFTHQSATTAWTAPVGYTVRHDNMHTFVADSIAPASGTYVAPFSVGGLSAAVGRVPDRVPSGIGSTRACIQFPSAGSSRL